MSNLEFMWNLTNVNNVMDNLIEIIKLCVIIIFTFYIFVKIVNIKDISAKNFIIFVLSLPIISTLAIIIQIKTDIYFRWIILILLISLINYINFNKNIMYDFSLTIISFSISYAIYMLAVAIAFIPTALFKIDNDYLGLIFILTIYMLLIIIVSRLKKIKYGIVFLQKKLENSYFNILILNTGAMTIFSLIILQSYSGLGVAKVGTGFSLLAITMFITMKNSIDTYYKQNLLTKDLEQTKSELEEKKQEIDKLEKENLEFSKTSHSLAHKQKSLEYKLEQLMKTGVDIQSKEVIKQEIQNISKEVYKEPQLIELPKTEIESIDDMFSYMQSECIKDNIKFELQVLGNVFYMINHLISESELEILIADHIKDAIIAINHSDNTNRSILVRIGKIDNVYSLYIYDSGIEFEKEVLEKLGKKPITTHSDTGGTGMGFMNTFDTLNRTKASLIINEIGKPCIDNYTKVLIFKFDNKNEFIVNSYKNEVVVV